MISGYLYTMLNSINSPLLLSLVFPALTMLGAVPLLRWAIGNERRDVFASVSMGLACIIAVICAFGRIGEPFQFGMAALAYGLIFITVFSLLYCLWVPLQTLRSILCVVMVLVWVWILSGMPLVLPALFKASIAATALLGIGLICMFKSRREFLTQETPLPSLLMLLIIAGTLAGFGFGLGDMIAGYFALSLCIIALGGMFWCWPRFDMQLGENALLPLAASVSALAWDMWLQGHLPLFSVVCLMMVLFSGRAAQKIVANGPGWLGRFALGVRTVLSLLPVGLSVVFFDILRSM